jgi:hypothetical protein
LESVLKSIEFRSIHIYAPLISRTLALCLRVWYVGITASYHTSALLLQRRGGLGASCPSMYSTILYAQRGILSAVWTLKCTAPCDRIVD